MVEPGRTALYHWTSAEVWQTRHAADRQGLSGEHLLRRLPWSDLQQVFLDGPAALPGALNFGLKEVAAALRVYDPRYPVAWPAGLEQGQSVMVMGWRAYREPQPLQTPEMQALQAYLQADCQALWNILRWLRRAVLEDY